MAKIKIENTEITIISVHDNDYISLTDFQRKSIVAIKKLNGGS